MDKILTVCGFCDFKSFDSEKVVLHWKHCKAKRELLHEMMFE